MKFQTRVTVSLKDGVLDPQGKTIGNALMELGFENILKVNTGKIFTLEIEAETESEASQVASEAASKLLANPVIEQFKVEVIL
jgi:phosphoribosylformylglycinamidine synthase PurS subunit